MPKQGLYESIITESLNRELENIDRDNLSIKRSKLHPAEVGDRLALHLGKVLMSALSSVNDKKRVDVGVHLVRDIIDCIDKSLVQARFYLLSCH